jgi:protein SCO1
MRNGCSPRVLPARCARSQHYANHFVDFGAARRQGATAPAAAGGSGPMGLAFPVQRERMKMIAGRLELALRLIGASASRSGSVRLSRRGLLKSFVVSIGLIAPTACSNDAKWHAIDISGSLPPLSFTMTRAEDDKTVTQADYRGKVVLLYFGYTNCPDVCPETLANIDDVLTRLGPASRDVRVLFATVDPNRDTAPVLAAYVKNFGPQLVGLRGTPDELAVLARRYRVVYAVTPKTVDRPYEVMHSSAIYVFDRSGAARLIVASLASTTPDLAGTAADLRRLVAEAYPSKVRGWLRQLV